MSSQNIKYRSKSEIKKTKVMVNLGQNIYVTK